MDKILRKSNQIPKTPALFRAGVVGICGEGAAVNPTERIWVIKKKRYQEEKRAVGERKNSEHGK